MKSTRRQFMMVSAVSVATLASAKVAFAQPMLAETDAQAVALGYVASVASVNKTKHFIGGPAFTLAHFFTAL